MHGFHGRYLRIDVATGATQVVPLPEDVLRRYLGGIGLGAWLLLRESGERYDALAPQAPLIFAFAPLAGTALNTSAKAAVVSKSPLTGRLNDAMISSRFALDGKGTGYDALVIVGQRPGLNTLVIEPSGVRIEATPELAGLSAHRTERLLQERLGAGWSIVAAGPAGEALVPFATLSHDGRHAGRGGTGAVLASKGLKALAVRGALRPPVADPARLDVLRQELKLASAGPGTEKYRTTGTLGNLLVFNRMGILPTDNFRAESSPHAEALSAERVYAERKVVRATCADCMIGCEKRVTSAGGEQTRVEYENVYALGPMLDNWDLDLVVEASRRCDELGLDTITAGATLAFARECVQRGLLDMPALGRPAAEFLLPALDSIARREGDGALLALGSRALSRNIGQGSEDFAPHVKGLELPGYHPGALQTLGLGLAVGSRGADHNKSGAYDLDLSGTVDRFTLDVARVEEMVELENQAALIDSLILCKFVRRAVRDLYLDGAAILAALTGWAITPAELIESARCIHHLKKLFNQRQGWDASEDTLPARFFAAGNGAAHASTVRGRPDQTRTDTLPGIDPERFREARSRYYACRGWSPEGALPADPALLESLHVSKHATPPA